ncbi:DUF4301 family protein [Salegentibacter chungangensis]|uniref:DUF4301 family protein n=1 Tax=Salegentibacter chungangensis TaxID=1335724 RepID=A0ABW3NPU4_9FLAO
MKLSEKDILQIKEKGLTTEEVERQIEIFKRGNIKVDIREAATVGKGISEYSEARKKNFIGTFEARKDQLKVMKFVPASGAATRMFKALHNFVNEFHPDKESLREYLDKKENQNLQRFFTKIDQLPFYEMAQEKAKENHSDFEDKTSDEQRLLLVETMLYSNGLDLSNYPKGLVPFHKYDDHLATAFEEHLYGASLYLDVNGKTSLHFTVAEGDKEKFEKEFEAIKDRLEKDRNTKFEISYSYQDPKTDTIAVDDHNEPFRTKDGKLFFRPGGHGALIENLNQQDADLVFIKNIDNVVVKQSIGDVVEYKKMLGGNLLELQEQIFRYLKELTDHSEFKDEFLSEIKDFLETKLCAKIQEFESLSTSEKVKALQDKLDRPLRVCGMVKNEGEPGGGPFLVKNKDGEVSLQIIEGAQIDKDNPEQLKIAREATHFNPVDIVCGIHNFKGEAFDLQEFVDPEMSFIADKTKDGKPLKALERPGLWNGGMAKWNTVFVEVPVSTFNPVKTVADLLKSTHQVH